MSFTLTPLGQKSIQNTEARSLATGAVKSGSHPQDSKSHIPKSQRQDLGIIADSSRARRGACELVSTTRIEFLAVGQHDFLNPDFQRSTFGRKAAYSDHVARLDRIFRPPSCRQTIGASWGSFPTLDVPFVIFNTHRDSDMGIDELEACRWTSYSDRLRRIVVCRPVVGERRAGTR